MGKPYELATEPLYRLDNKHQPVPTSGEIITGGECHYTNNTRKTPRPCRLLCKKCWSQGCPRHALVLYAPLDRNEGLKSPWRNRLNTACHRAETPKPPSLKTLQPYQAGDHDMSTILNHPTKVHRQRHCKFQQDDQEVLQKPMR